MTVMAMLHSAGAQGGLGRGEGHRGLPLRNDLSLRNERRGRGGNDHSISGPGCFTFPSLAA